MEDIPLDRLPLPTRMASWARLHDVGTLLQLASIPPSVLRTQRNIGRRSIAQTRAVIEGLVGKRWEELSGGGPTPAPRASWAAAARAPRMRPHQLPPAPVVEGDVPLEQVDLPTRMANWADENGFGTLRRLAWIPPDVLMRERNIGRLSMAETRREIERRLGARWEDLARPASVLGPSPSERAAQRAQQAAERAAEERRDALRARLTALLGSAGLFEAFSTVVAELPEKERRAVRVAAGLDAAVPTQTALARSLGVAFGTVSSHAHRGAKRLGRKCEWISSVRERCSQALPGGAVFLETLAADPWWAEMAARPHTLDWFGSCVLGDLHLVQVSGLPYAARVPQVDIDRAWREVRAAGRAVPLPAPPAVFHALVDPWSDRLGSALTALLRGQIDAMLLLDPGSPEPRVLRFGASLPEEVLAFLEASPRPLTFAELREKLGYDVVPEQALSFGRSLVGTERHFPDFVVWMERLVPPAIDAMVRGPRGRQWSQHELHAAIRDEQRLPDWLGPFHLGSLLRRSGKVEDVGHGKFALPGAAGERVSYVREMVRILRAAGKPVSKASLVKALEQRMSINRLVVAWHLRKRPFLRCARSLYGLLDRDLPGGAGALAEAADHVVKKLERRGRGMTVLELAASLKRLGGPLRRWTPEMIVSALGNDPRLRRPLGNFGLALAAWESPRVKSRLEIARECIDRGGGKVLISTLARRLEEAGYERPTNTQIWAFTNQGMARRGKWLVRRRPAPAEGTRVS